MIERATLEALAASRRIVTLAPGGLRAVVLWPEPHSDAWRIILPGAMREARVRAGAVTFDDPPRATLLYPDRAEVLSTDGVYPIAPVVLATDAVHDDPADRTTPYSLLEAALVAAYFGLGVTFRYAKGAAPAEPRRGKAIGVRSDLLFLADAERGGGTRSFRLDGICDFRLAAGSPVPRWDGRGYALPAVA